ncbi:hemin-degrading HemS.ChuX domain protein [Mycobacteroides abscessus subsp. bolletii 1513]|uniref:Hemin-degrading HemS.ChuX domain protein n=1 Tax=Mycobacteroides abscessus subsp. bolletii 1513 TaxID=1299321 RepID=X8DV20_9MYCO|nr:hemin-degrading HemS.ChuX domain protein [Mycobacteroides abscessus subsp. bolletii 1513]
MVAVTANDAALLSHTGEYLEPAFPGEALSCDDEYIALRLNPALVRDAFVAPRALTMVGETGTHRAYLTPLSDHLTVGALELAPAPAPESFPVTDWSDISWRDSDQLIHLDALTPARYRVLPFTGARKIDSGVVPYLLAHLVDVDMPFTIAVPGGGCVQLHRGHAAMAEQAGAHLAVIFGASRYALDPVFIAESWVTQAHGTQGVTSSVELYDHSHRCVTSITQTGPITARLHRAWEHMVASLPDCA